MDETNLLLTHEEWSITKLEANGRVRIKGATQAIVEVKEDMEKIIKTEVFICKINLNIMKKTRYNVIIANITCIMFLNVITTRRKEPRRESNPRSQ